LSANSARTTAIQRRYGQREQFLQKVNPDTQAYFAMKPEVAVTGDFPTLDELRDCYGEQFASAWLVPQIYDVSAFTGARNLTEKQQEYFHKTFRDYFPVYSKAWDDVKQYAGYFEVPFNRHLELTEENYSYELSAITLISKTKREATKITNKLNRHSLQRIDAIIRHYKNLKPQVKAFINGKNI
jgi:hypothetical protein